MNTTNAITGEIVAAGRDEEGQVRLIIHTTEAELKQLSDLPLYCPSKITIERITDESK